MKNQIVQHEIRKSFLNYRKVHGARLFTIRRTNPNDPASGWEARLRNTSRSRIASARPHPKGWEVRYLTIRNIPVLYSIEATRRLAIIHLGEAAQFACQRGWYASLLSELDVALHKLDAHPTSAAKGQGASIIPIGSSTLLVALPVLCQTFASDEPSVRTFLQTINCPVVIAPNRLSYVSLWVLELCLLIHCTKTTPADAAALLVQAQTVYKAARREKVLDRLERLGKSLHLPS